jgi:DNA adenine methylase
MTNTLTPPLKWHGGKHYLAPHIHQLAKRATYTHRVITHAGGLGELWSWDCDGVSEVVNDLNEQLTDFWDSVLRDPKTCSRVFSRIVQATPFSEDALSTVATSESLRGTVPYDDC